MRSTPMHTKPSNRRQFLRSVSLLTLAGLLPQFSACQKPNSALANASASLKIATSIYVGWVPWMLAAANASLKRQGQRFGMDLQLVRGDYAETIDQYISGHVDAITITNIDALAAFAEAKIESDVILIGSFSAGNDAIVQTNKSAAQLRAGNKIGLVRNSVSEYLLDRYLEQQKIPFDAIDRIDISDADMLRVFVEANAELSGVVTWNPIVSALEQRANGHRLFDSKQLPREIADCLVVRRSVLEAKPEFARALLSTWFDTMANLNGAARQTTLATLAQLSGASVPEYLEQLASTELLDTPSKARAALADPAVGQTMERVASFVERTGLAKTERANWVSTGSDSNGVLRFNPGPLQAM